MERVVAWGCFGMDWNVFWIVLVELWFGIGSDLELRMGSVVMFFGFGWF